MLKFILSIVAIVTCSLTFCQEKVKIEKVIGLVQYSERGVWHTVKPATSVKVNDHSDLKMGRNSSCIVSCSKGARYLPSENGRVLNLSCASLKQSFWEMAINLLAGAFSDPDEKVGATTYRGEKYLMLFPADEEVVISDRMSFSWSKDLNNSYDFFLLEKAASVNWLCNKIAIEDTFITESMCPSIKTLAIGKRYYWSVRPSFNESQKSYFLVFTVADEATKTRLTKQLMELEKIKSFTDAEVYETLKATVYYDMKMYSESYRILSAAKGIYPQSEFVSQAYVALVEAVSNMNQKKNQE